MIAEDKLQEEGYYIKDGKIYNLQGRLIYEKPFKTVTEYCTNIIKVDDQYITLDGKYSISSSPKIDQIVNSIAYLPSLVEKYLKRLSRDKKLSYLNHNILFAEDGFICSKDPETDCIYYYTYDGKKILSTDETGFCYIDTTFTVKEDERHIIRIGKIDSHLNCKYGYYDLDKKCS